MHDSRNWTPPVVHADGVTDAQYIAALEFLRAHEGDSVTLLCDNPDGPPDYAIECCGDWTGWAERRFSSTAEISRHRDLVAHVAELKWKHLQGEQCDE